MTTTTATVKERPILFSGPMVRAILEGKKTQTRRVIGEQKRLPHLFERLKAEPRFVRFMDWRRGFGAEFVRGDMLDCQDNEMTVFYRCRYGQSGERLWVRETLQRGPSLMAGELSANTMQYAATLTGVPFAEGAEIGYCGKALWQWPDKNKRPSIFMPRWASRITLEIVSVHVERLQEINADDCANEGIQYPVRQSNVEGKVSPLLRLTGQHPPTNYLPREYGHDDLMRAHFASGWDGLNAKRGYSWDSNCWVWVITFRRL